VLVRKEEEGRVANLSGQFGGVAESERVSDGGVGRRRETPRRSGCGLRFRILGGARPE